jgi:hypothetical protein
MSQCGQAVVRFDLVGSLNLSFEQASSKVCELERLLSASEGAGTLCRSCPHLIGIGKPYDIGCIAVPVERAVGMPFAARKESAQSTVLGKVGPAVAATKDEVMATPPCTRPGPTSASIITAQTPVSYKQPMDERFRLCRAMVMLCRVEVLT